jgi:preprotein translocase subunit SecF
MADTTRSGWERFSERLVGACGYLFLAFATVASFLSDDIDLGSRLATLALVAGAAAWIYALYTRMPEPRKEPRLRLYALFVGVLAFAVVLMLRQPVFFIFMIIYAAFGSAKWACLHLVNVAVARVGGLLALFITGTHFSVSSGVGFLALFGASVQTGVIMVEYINQLRASGLSIENAAIEGATRRLRPIIMTMLVATLGLLPAALSHAIGSDSQRPFAIVIVGGLTVDLIMSTLLLPTFYVWWARPTDRLPTA